MQYLQIPNFHRWQHYKDRTPPWIKLHRDLLRDYDFGLLPDKSKAHLVLIWLLASQVDNRIPNDPSYLQRAIGAQERPDIKLLIGKGFLVPVAGCKQDASKSLSECSTLSNMRETETEAEEERETENPPTPFPDWLPVDLFLAFREMRKGLKAPLTVKAEQLAIAQLERLRGQGHDPTAVIEQSVLRGWKSFYRIKGDNDEHTGRYPNGNSRPGGQQGRTRDIEQPPSKWQIAGQRVLDKIERGEI